MTYEQYWYGDAAMVRAFYKADKIRQERQNNEAWLQGMYFYDALSTALYNFASSKRTPSKNYPSKPYDIGAHIETEQERKKREENEEVLAMAYMSSMVQNGKNWGKKGG